MSVCHNRTWLTKWLIWVTSRRVDPWSSSKLGLWKTFVGDLHQHIFPGRLPSHTAVTAYLGVHTMSVQTVYFGYGSNIWLDQMARRCPQSKFIGVGSLADWYAYAHISRLLKWLEPFERNSGNGSSTLVDTQPLYHLRAMLYMG
jgi:hypothetical protein